MAIETILALLALLFTDGLAAPSRRPPVPGLIYAPVNKLSPGSSNPLNTVLVTSYVNGTIDLPLRDRAYTLGAYTLSVTVGTPPQPIMLQMDTGSSGTWLFSPKACKKIEDQKILQDCGGTFRPENSTTAREPVEKLDNLYNVYGDRSFVAGDYFSDTLDLGGVNGEVKDLTMGYAVEARGPVFLGILGMGLRSLETIALQTNKSYPTILETLQDQGAIASKSFSMYLNQLETDDSHVIFGGYDPSHMADNLTVVPIMTDPYTGERNRYLVPLTGFQINAMDGGTWVDRKIKAISLPVAANIDSGTPLTRLPNDVFAPLARFFSARKDSSGAYVVDCATKQAIGFLTFGIAGDGDLKSGVIIKTLLSDAVIHTPDMPPGQCLFAFMPTDHHAILGDSFLKSAYVVIDQDNMAIGIAPAAPKKEAGEFVAFGKDGVLGVPGSKIMDGVY